MSGKQNKVYLGDNLALMRYYPNNYFDIGIVDPPYGINAPNMNMGSSPNRNEPGQYPGTSTAVKLKNKLQRLNGGGGKLKNRILNTSVIEWDYEQPSPEYWRQLFRITKNQIIFGGNYFDLPPTRGIIFWDKLQPWENFSQFELVWTSFDKPAKVYRISNTGGANQETKIHPTQKPVKLYDNIYRDFVKPGMKILDTHLGSGSHRITAFKADVDFIGCEINKQYYFDQEKRFKNFTSDIRINF